MSCSCPRRCRPWQGKFISRSGRTTEITDLNGRKYKVYPLSQTSYGEPDGLFGINCGHRPRGVSDGLFTKTSKTSEEYGADDEELYYKVCKQRELERKVRKSKTEADMLDAAGDSEGARTVRQKANQYNKELKGYCQQNGLKYRSDRVKTYGAIEPKKTLDKSDGSGIIKVDRVFRKMGNTGAFSVLPEKMSKKHIRDIADKFGFDISGLTLNIDMNEELLRMPFAGEAVPEHIGTITFFPNAFRSEEELIRTMYHESIHVEQFKEYGVEYVQNHLEEFEKLAYEAENAFIECLKKEGKL